MKSISIFGTSSDSGKSTLTFAIGKILQEKGLKVAPFKAQNVSNNSSVCKDGSEIGVAQYFQGEVLKVEPSYHMNPVLLKIEGNGRSQIIVNGQVKDTTSPREYYKKIEDLKPAVKKSFQYLEKNYDVVVAEGAGSPVELNLIHKDLANTFVAKEFDTKIILVADIEKGGVFASIYGTLNLLEPKLRKNVIGVIINKFRGDPTLFDEGIKIIEKDFKVPVLGVIPYAPFNLGFEDSQSLVNYKQIKKKWKIKVGVVLFPRMSNYNDIEPLIADSEIKVEFISSDRDLKEYDLVILPGTKSTIEDLKWLKKVGLYERILKTNVKLYGICGGYQMFFKNIIDKDCVENLKRQKERGFGFIDDKIIFKNKKILNRGNYFVFSMKIKGFEIHNGVSKKYPLFCQKKNLKGSFIHGIFDNNNFRKMIFTSINKDYQGFDFGKYKKKKISKFVNLVKKNIDLNLLEN